MFWQVVKGMRLAWYILLTLPLATASNRGKKREQRADGWAYGQAMGRQRVMFCRTCWTSEAYWWTAQQPRTLHRAHRAHDTPRGKGAVVYTWGVRGLGGCRVEWVTFQHYWHASSVCGRTPGWHSVAQPERKCHLFPFIQPICSATKRPPVALNNNVYMNAYMKKLRECSC